MQCCYFFSNRIGVDVAIGVVHGVFYTCYLTKLVNCENIHLLIKLIIIDIYPFLFVPEQKPLMHVSALYISESITQFAQSALLVHAVNKYVITERGVTFEAAIIFSGYMPLSFFTRLHLLLGHPFFP